LLLSVSHAQEAKDTCYALALEGGGNKGSYQAGVIWGFAHYGNPDEFQWDVVSGISAGAVNTGALSVWAPDQMFEMSEWLSDMWAGLTTKDVWKNWPGGIFEGLLLKNGVFNSEPLLNYLQSIFDGFDGIKRWSVVGTCDSNSGDFVTFDETTPYDQWAYAVVSSASIPAVFPARPWGDWLFIDGGTVSGLNANSAIEKCFANGYSEENITLDVIMLEKYDQIEKGDLSDTIGNMLEQHEIHAYYNGMNNVIETMEAYPKINYRYLLQPSKPVPGGIGLIKFGNETTWPMQENGREDA
jgi:predicted acylesterase/phospholipase RssA